MTRECGHRGVPMAKRLPIVACALVVLVAACGSSSHASAPNQATTAPGTSGTLGVGVTPTEIHVGVALVDFNCIKPFVDGLRFNQDKVYQAFVDDVNQRGGINGRKLVATYKTYCPIQSAPALAACTSLTEDSDVFAVMGTLADFSGDAQKCVTAQHKRVLLSQVVSQQEISQAPPGLFITPEVTPERRAAIVLALLKSQHTLDGKKIAVLGEQVTEERVHKVIEPGLKALGLKLGTTAILSISGTDTTAAQSQLDSFIERWKTEDINALFMVGDQVSHTQFIQKVRAALPNLQLVGDTDAFGGYAQDENTAGVKPNPYEGALTAEGLIGAQQDQTANWKECAAIYHKETGKTVPGANNPPPLGGGKYDDTHGAVNDACEDITMFAAVATRAGKTLNDDTWQKTVNNYGSIPDMGVVYGSLHQGKYDADDTFGLAAFDSSVGPKGDWRAVTPVIDVSSG